MIPFSWFASGGRSGLKATILILVSEGGSMTITSANPMPNASEDAQLLVAQSTVSKYNLLERESSCDLGCVPKFFRTEDKINDGISFGRRNGVRR